MPLLVGAMSYGDRASGLKKETKTEAELLASTVQSLAQAGMNEHGCWMNN